MPGMIGKIASTLGERNINLSNIRIMESREDVPGVLRLSFRSDVEMQKAAVTLRKTGTPYIFKKRLKYFQKNY